jgi:hypothetical protein
MRFAWIQMVSKRSSHHFAYLVAYIYTRPINVGIFWNLNGEEQRKLVEGK